MRTVAPRWCAPSSDPRAPSVPAAALVPITFGRHQEREAHLEGFRMLSTSFRCLHLGASLPTLPRVCGRNPVTRRTRGYYSSIAIGVPAYGGKSAETAAAPTRFQGKLRRRKQWAETYPSIVICDRLPTPARAMIAIADEYIEAAVEQHGKRHS